VPCAEGHADPSQPTAVADNCFDGVDNDGDGLTDFAGGDPDCLLATDLQFEIGLDPDDPGVEIQRSVRLRCLNLGQFSLTFGNIESPVPPGVDPDLTNNSISQDFVFGCEVP
jgi:hypothetical protein